MAPIDAAVRTALNATSLLSPSLAGRAAFALFCRPLRRSRVRSTELDVHARAATEELTVNGKRVVAYRWGDGTRPVLLLHGWRSRTSRFADWIPRLLDLGYSPVGFDAPGHGDSQGRGTTILEYRELIGRLQDRYGHFEGVVAHSFGVLCAFHALRTGVTAERLVALSGVSDFTFVVDGFCAGLGVNDRIRRELVRRIERELFPGTPDPLRVFDAGRAPEEVPLPILVVHDEQDDVVPHGQARRLQAAYGERLRLLTTRGLGHRRIVAEPTVVDNAIGFLAEPLAAEVPAPAR
ncbi:alpha/beta hydrolase [Kitasatospora sp. NPDC048365]|uniref:alpha/beta hydrolase n=1 Tax=Kitasatospora sp. NPDC048365 TaxID=3364050 RepID=UPI003716E924